MVFRLERRVSKLDGSGTRCELVYGVTSRPGTGEIRATELLKLVRGHWTVESHHWIRDVVFDEDRSQIRKGNGPRMMATLRNLAVGILRLSGATSIAKAVRWCARRVDACWRLVGRS